MRLHCCVESRIDSAAAPDSGRHDPHQDVKVPFLVGKHEATAGIPLDSAQLLTGIIDSPYDCSRSDLTWVTVVLLVVGAHQVWSHSLGQEQPGAACKSLHQLPVSEMEAFTVPSGILPVVDAFALLWPQHPEVSGLSEPVALPPAEGQVSKSGRDQERSRRDVLAWWRQADGLGVEDKSKNLFFLLMCSTRQI